MRPRRFLAFLLAASAIIASSAQAQVAIYHLRFEKTGSNVNYQAYSEGYAVVPLEGGLADLILQLESGLTRQFVHAPGMGEYFVATQNSASKGVLANSNSEGTPINFFTVIGNPDTTLKAGDDNLTLTARVPDSMNGYILTADPLDSSLVEPGADNSGSAGISEMKASLDDTHTREANTQNQTVEQASATLVEMLLAKGFVRIEAAEEEDDDDAEEEPVVTPNPNQSPNGF